MARSSRWRGDAHFGHQAHDFSAKGVSGKAYAHSMPPEFIPFLTTSGDGERYGYVVHALELGLSDLVALNQPMMLLAKGHPQDLLQEYYV